MEIVIFYEKPGCINNTKQKALLKAAGHNVQAHNLLTESWTVETLRLFFGTLPVADWFNRSAPAVKAGDVIPENMDENTALLRMVQNPLLIRRPLIQVGNLRAVGFDMAIIDAWIGLQSADTAQDLQTCPRDRATAPG
ncbi:hypothetical protein DO97_10230 [Neosynechococcus sphagnicola sy1]|uniref:Nitrogenase-associated protein n=1 Tax=Neosynechococcus sphagnicola sy1 TaxID=1497020 RepID=A0A098TNE5_9CYAN|nr:ArsC/Spx/MgsR family protein [Neosynechococcus sphagnicola]KGF73781.1 hypothetical protein DO97_10230 [Neosynechococcus sphagnicola sy1]